MRLAGLAILMDGFLASKLNPRMTEDMTIRNLSATTQRSWFRLVMMM